jgi:pantoate--beta-alanine ligase
MGALHEGHLSLLERARPGCDQVVLSIFVNPLQFGVREDLGRYPRDLDADLARLQGRGCDVVFAPTAEEMYAPDNSTRIDVGALGDALCGRTRPGHFQGVATVVAKLFNLVQPQVAVFGQKDAQQAVILNRMVRDLDWALEMRVAPVVRDPDGLALSSRNVYLSVSERHEALLLHGALHLARAAIVAGERRVETILDAMRRHLAAGSDVRIDYVEIVDPNDLGRRTRLEGRCLIAIAAYVGATRLIDNLVLDLCGAEVMDSGLLE